MCASHPAILLSQIRPQPSCNVSEIEIEIESEISEEETQNNIWNKMLELFTLQGNCPLLQYQLKNWDMPNCLILPFRIGHYLRLHSLGWTFL